jgi:predicted HicB family RNase H-like nuclease
MKKSVKPSGVFIPLTRKEINRLEELVKRGGKSVQDWLLLVALGAIACDEENVAFEPRKGAGEMMVKIPKRTAARLERAAEFEEVGVAAYVKDCIRRDLDLTDEMIASKN